MLNSISKSWLIAGWCVALTIVTGLNLAYGMRPVSAVFFLAVGLAPAVILLMLGGQPSQTVAEVLRSVDAADTKR